MLDLGKHKDTDEIPLRLDEEGTVRVGDTQVSLDVVMGAYDRGGTAEEIAQKFSEVKLADVYAVIAYYLRHEGEVREYLGKRGLDAASLRKETEANPANRKFRERLLRLKQERALSGSS